MVMEVKRVGFVDAVEYLNEILCSRSKLKKGFSDKKVESGFDFLESV